MTERPEDYDINSFDVDALLDKDGEDITDDELAAMFEHYRKLRAKFEALDAKGQARRMTSKPKDEPTDEELLNVRVLD